MLLNRLTSSWAVAAWLTVTAGVIIAFWNYELTAGQSGSHPVHWPQASELLPSDAQRQLVMFVHPQCRCTKAGLNELGELLKDVPQENHPAILFVLLQPDERESPWKDTENERQCRSFSAARIQNDPRGIHAEHFGVLTSGTCLLYSADGQLLFAGGITQSRGHRGPNRGRDLLTQCLNLHPEAAANKMPIRHHVAFGCPVFSDSIASRNTAL